MESVQRDSLGRKSVDVGWKVQVKSFGTETQKAA